jgi:F0F1-type ATP synthase delta subunit
VIATAYQALADAHAARVRVTVRTAHPLTDALRLELEQALR